MSERAARGMWLHGTAPYGYCLAKGRALRILPSEQDTVIEAFEQHVRTGSYSEVAAALNQAGRDRRGRRWTAGTVQRIIENPIYTGTYRHWGHTLTRPKLRIITDQAWEESVRIRGQRPNAGKRASDDVRAQAIANVFKQYVDGLKFVEQEPDMRPVAGTRRPRANPT